MRVFEVDFSILCYSFPPLCIPAVVVMAPVVPEEWDLVDMGCEAIEMELDFVPVAPFLDAA